ncbi:MAG TPA: DUF748 domain-containing protein [Rhodocyclaceae bacterium]
MFNLRVCRSCLYRSLAAVAAAIALFALLGYLWLPGYAKGKLEILLSEQLHRPVSIEHISVSPFALAATVEGLKVGERQGGGSTLSFARLYVNLSSASLLRRIPVIEEVQLEGPTVHLERQADGRYNVSDLLDEWLSGPAKPTPEFSVANISISGGRIDFDDGPKKARHSVSDLALGIPFIANTPATAEIFVEPHFRATVDGAPFILAGKLRPFGGHREANLALELKDFDLTRVYEYSPLNLPFSLSAGRLNTQLDLAFSQGKEAAPAITLSGSLALHEVALSSGKTRLLALKRLALEGVAVDLRAQRAEVKKLSVEAPQVSLRRGADGQLDLVKLLLPPSAGKPVAKPAVAATSWQWRVAEAAVSGGSLQYSDDSLGDKVPPLQAEDLSLAVSGLSSAADAAAHFDLRAKINRQGRIAAQGELQLTPLALKAAVDGDKVDLVALQGWAAEHLNAVLTQGSLSLKGQAAYSAAGASFKGDASLNDFVVLDQLNAVELLRWRSLRLAELDVAAGGGGPLRLAVTEIFSDGLFARAMLTEKGKLNISGLLKQTPAEAAAATAAAPPPSEAASDTTQIRIGKINVRDGSMNFTDRFIKPNYRANLTGLNGSIGALAAGKPSAIRFSGKVDRIAPLELSGQIDPLGKPVFVDLAIKAKGVEMTTFSPYSSRYLGYEVEKGKLSVDLHYHVEKGELVAENKVFLDQITFGNKVDSPDALDFPMGLIVGLLKNSRGEIDINLPVSGSLNDPQFSIGGIIGKMILNLLSKAVTAPFALLGSLFGGGEDLSYAAFDAGHGRLTAEGEKRLQTLAKALKARDTLKLEITGVADPELEREAYKHAVLERKVRAQKAAELAREGKAAGNLGELKVAAEEYPKYLEKAYKAEDFKKPRNLLFLTKNLPVAEMEALMLEHIAAGEAELLQLAQNRGQTVQTWLVNQGEVDPQRLYLLAPKLTSAAPKDAPPGGRAEFSLK